MEFKKFFEANKKILFLSAGLFILFAALSYYFEVPKEFPLGQVVTIYSGESLDKITSDLESLHIIRSPFWFRTAVILQGGERGVIAGDYLLDEKAGPINIAYRLVHARFHLTTARITIPEGWDSTQIADYLKKNLVNFNQVRFLNIAKKEEGYLFPDTYFVSPTIKPEVLIDKMEKTFNEKIKSVPGIATTTKSLGDIITMASILENEARTTESRRIIAGILWKRLQLGMPLQVDATFLYINGKNTYQLTADDLKINSPYNTYLYKGLPPGPIDNPGVDALFAAVNPITTKYLYYLSSRDGTIHYAQTFEQHKRNAELYLN